MHFLPSERMLEAVSGGIKIVDQTERFCLAVSLLRIYKIILWTFGSRSLAFKFTVCRRKAVKVKARVHSAIQGMFIVQCQKGKGKDTTSQFPAIHMIEIVLEESKYSLIWGILVRRKISQIAILLFYLRGDSQFYAFQFSTVLGCIENFFPWIFLAK